MSKKTAITLDTKDLLTLQNLLLQNENLQLRQEALNRVCAAFYAEVAKQYGRKGETIEIAPDGKLIRRTVQPTRINNIDTD